MNREDGSGPESERLDALHRYDILDTPAEAAFDRITWLAQLALQTPIVLVSLVDQDRQWFKSRLGLDACETPREISFCTHAIQQDEPLIVRNALEDPRFAGNPLVTGEPHIRFYLGAPLRTSDGQNIGTLCAIDRVPRDASPTQIAAMQDLARLVMDELELRRMATTDSLTGAITRRAFASEAVREIARAKRYRRRLGCVLIDIDHFKAINDRHGHAAGDLVLQTLVQVCRRELRAVDLVCRLGGEEFAILLPETGLEGTAEVAERLRTAVAATVIDYGPVAISVTASLGVSELLDCDDDVDALVERADRGLYETKCNGRNRAVCAGPKPDPMQKDCKVA